MLLSSPPDWATGQYIRKITGYRNPQHKRMTQAPGIQYSEDEAASLLGVSIDQLRCLVREHIIKDEAASTATPIPSLHRSDLVVLRILVGMSHRTEVTHA